MLQINLNEKDQGQFVLSKDGKVAQWVRIPLSQLQFNQSQDAHGKGRELSPTDSPQTSVQVP